MADMDRIAAAAAQLGEFATQASQIAIETVRVNAITDLSMSAMVALAGAGLVYAGVRLWRAAQEDYQDDWKEPSALIAFCVGALFVLPLPCVWLNPWTWIAFTNPNLVLAKSLLGL